ncbi:DUF7660 family protein [Tautonia marina]|uniref:DUF7660 family protein n=1 Tax=Tautonia marina TaxID=2653855 RepID=UPI0012607CFC|nr:hypothetical protein [Tautonia marina]
MNLPESAQSRADLVEHIRSLLDDLDANEAEWENSALGDFLEALAAWLTDCGKASPRNDEGVIDPDRPSWQLFASALSAARVYE